MLLANRPVIELIWWMVEIRIDTMFNQLLDHLAVIRPFDHRSSVLASEIRYKQRPILDVQYFTGIFECDVAISDVYYSARLLGEACDNYTALSMNSSSIYNISAQEDKAVLEVLLHAAGAKLIGLYTCISRNIYGGASQVSTDILDRS
jgi:hypothetical protein